MFAKFDEMFVDVRSDVDIKPQTLSDATQVQGDGSEAYTYFAAQAVAMVAFTSASGAEGDVYDVELVLETSDTDDFAVATELASMTASFVVDDNDGAHKAMVVLPKPLKGAQRYVRSAITFTANGGNTGTASAISAAVALQLGDAMEGPAEGADYDRDGYFKLVLA